MNVFRKASLSVAGLALAFGGLTTVTMVQADAAAPCAAENQAAGAANNDAAHKAAAYKKAKKKLKKAKKAYKKHHTKANKKRLKKAKRAKKRALARYKAAHANAVAANDRANRCHAPSTSSPSPSPSSPATSADVVSSLTDALVSAGVPQTVIDQLQPALGPLGDALAGTPLDQLQPVVDQVAAAIAGGVDPGLLVTVIHQITDPLTAAGVPANTIADALEQALAQIPTDPSQIPSDPTTLIDTVVGSVEQALTGTPLEQLDPVLEQVRTGLDGALGGGLPTLPGL